MSNQDDISQEQLDEIMDRMLKASQEPLDEATAREATARLLEVPLAPGDETIPPETIDEINARSREATEISPELLGSEPFFIHRIFCHDANVTDLPTKGDSLSVSVHDKIRNSRATLGILHATRRVGPFTVRLAKDIADDFWWIVETSTHDKRVVLLNYGPEGKQAREASAQYAASATETDLESDFNPAAHYFGERRISKAHKAKT